MSAVRQNADFEVLRSVPLDVTAVLGSRRMTIAELLELGEGAVVTLDRSVSQPVDVLAGGTLVARGEIVSIEECFGVRITSVVGNDDA